MSERLFGRVLGVRERPAGGYLATAAVATDTVLELDDVDQFGEEPGQALLRDDDGNEETVDIASVDPEAETLTLEDGLASGFPEGTAVLAFPEIVTRYAEVSISGAEDDTVEALVPSQVARYLSLGTRPDEDRERVAIEYESETGNWIVHDVYVDDPEDNPVEVFWGDIADNPFDLDGAIEGSIIRYDATSGLWIVSEEESLGSGLILVEDDTTPIAAATTIDFGTGLDVTDDGGGHVTVDATGGGSDLEVKEGGASVDTGVAVLDFDDSDFNVTESPEDEINVALNYGTGAGQPAEGDHVHIGGGSTIVVKEGGTEVDPDVDTLDFDDSDFNLTESPEGEVNVALNYGTGAGQPAEGDHSHGGGGATIDDFTGQFLRDVSWIHDDCLYGTNFVMGNIVPTGFPIGPLTGRAGGSGTGIQGTNSVVSGAHPGVLEFTTGPTTTGNVMLLSSRYVIGAGKIRFGAWVRLEDLSSGTQRFDVQVGFMQGLLVSAIANGITFRYRDDVNSGAWQAVVDDAAGTTTDALDDNGGAITVAADTWYLLELEINAAGTSVEFFIDGVSKGVVTANIPDGAGEEPGINIGIAKSIGTTARLLYLDAYYCYHQLTTPR